MDWKIHIDCNPGRLGGKPAIRGTRLSVDFLFDLLGNGWSESQLLEGYPQLNPEHIKALYSYAASQAREFPYHDLESEG